MTTTIALVTGGNKGIGHAVVRRLAGLGWTVLLAARDAERGAARGADPDEPHDRPRGRASAFVTHAGMGGASVGLWQGVPMVAVPQAVDQFGNAARLAELGVARHLPVDEVTPESLRAALLSLDDPAVRARSAALRDELRAAGGARRAADLIEAELR